jgi:hypothetical protein
VKTIAKARIKKTVSRNIPESKDENLVTSYRWGWYGLSWLIPFAGIFIAMFLYDQDSREVRKVGRNCLVIGFVFWVVLPTLLILGFLAAGLFAAASFISDAMPPVD